MQKGNISVQTENIFPIIKKFLYSDHEIFLRELISNAVDATTKLRTLAKRGVITDEIGDTSIEILIDQEKGTLTIRDRGIGMTEEEVMKYLNQVAFSSAQEFIEQYKDESGIIGHFGLGFYSAFMVSSKVEVLTQSFKADSESVLWSCDGDPKYTLEKIDRGFRGTDIILHINEEDKEFLEEARISSLLNKYCQFLPVEIKFKEEVINNPAPIWKKQPAELKDEDYINFYQELYPNSPAPLFWIHLNIDYPFNLTGVLYFPKAVNSMEVQKNKIHLYSNQVYVTDDVKEIVPEFLTLLHGVIDSPDIPLNVSRSYLQSDRNVKRITSHITKKVADKLNDLFKNDRPSYEEKWNDISIFVKYGMVTEDKFFDRAKKAALVVNTENEYATIEEYKEKVKDNQTDKNSKVVFLYSNDEAEHDSFIQSAKGYGYDVLKCDRVIDHHFMQRIERDDTNISFVRVDSETVDNLVDKDEKKESVLSEEEENTIKAVFESQVDMKGATVNVKALSPEDYPVVITKPEFMRRMRDMSHMQGMDTSMFPDTHNVVVNSNHPIYREQLLAAETEEAKNELASHLYSLALLSQNMLKGADLTAFVKKSLTFLK